MQKPIKKARQQLPLGVVMSCFSLNNNPRVNAEKRLKQLHRRRDWIIAYKAGYHEIEYENGIAARMYINPRIKARKAGELIARINKEIGVVQRFLSSFK